MGFDTGYGGDQQDGGGSFFDDPSFLAQLQGAFGGGSGGGGGTPYDPPVNTQYGAIGAAGGPSNFAAGGNALFSPAQPPRPVSLPDGSQATSPFEVGGDSGVPGVPASAGNGYGAAQMPGRRNPGTRDRWGGGGQGGWYGGFGAQGGGGQQQWYRPQGPQGSSRPDPSNPGAAYDAGPGRWEAQQQAQRDEQAQGQPAGPRQPQGGPQRWGMPMGGAYGRPMPMRKRRFYGNGGGMLPPGGASPGPAPTGGGY